MKKRIIVSVILGCIMASLMVTGCKNNSSGQSNKDTGAGAEITTFLFHYEKMTKTEKIRNEDLNCIVFLLLLCYHLYSRKAVSSK